MESDNILRITVRFTMPGIIIFLKVDNILMLSNISTIQDQQSKLLPVLEGMYIETLVISVGIPIMLI